MKIQHQNRHVHAPNNFPPLLSLEIQWPSWLGNPSSSSHPSPLQRSMVQWMSMCRWFIQITPLIGFFFHSFIHSFTHSFIQVVFPLLSSLLLSSYSLFSFFFCFFFFFFWFLFFKYFVQEHVGRSGTLDNQFRSFPTPFFYFVSSLFDFFFPFFPSFSPLLICMYCHVQLGYSDLLFFV